MLIPMVLYDVVTDETLNNWISRYHKGTKRSRSDGGVVVQLKMVVACLSNFKHISETQRMSASLPPGTNG